jgi:hypothetical protein
VITGDITISAWVYRTVSGTDDPFVAESGGNRNYLFFINDDDRLGFSWQYGSNTWQHAYSTAYLGNHLNRWMHIASIRNAAAKTVKYYVDGRLFGSEVSYANNADGGNTSPRLFIGSSSATSDSNSTFQGLIDNVRIYNYVRTPAQIAWDYNRGKPIAHWAFNECQGSTIHDESGNGNHGTLNLGSSGVTAAGTCASSSDSFWYNGRNGKVGRGAGSFDGGMIMSISAIFQPLIFPK